MKHFYSHKKAFSVNPLNQTCFVAGTAHPSSAPEFPLDFSGVRVTRSFVLCVLFCRSLFFLFSFFFWSSCCLSFFDLRILITPLVPSNSSCTQCLAISYISHNMCYLYHMFFYFFYWLLICCSNITMCCSK